MPDPADGVVGAPRTRTKHSIRPGGHETLDGGGGGVGQTAVMGNGITIRRATADDWDELVHVDHRGFGYAHEQWWADSYDGVIDLERFQLALDGAEIVGVAGSYELEVTLPGGASVPMSGTTWVSVSSTHRRRGVLRGLMDALHRDADERGEPVASLWASEAGIYERFGYGLATQHRNTVIDTPRVRWREDLVSPARSTRFLQGDEAARHVADTWDRFRRTRAGEVARSAAWHRMMAIHMARPDGATTPTYYLAHADGYASYRIDQRWREGRAAGRLHLSELVAITPQAHVDLLATVLATDLMVEVDTWCLPLDDPLPFLLVDRRAVRTTVVNDGVWVNVRDVRRCFGARTYGSEDRLVIEADGERWAIEGSPEGGSCRKVRTRPDLVTDQATLGSLLYSGFRPSLLAAGRRLEARSAEALRRADAFFLGERLPLSITSY